MFGKKKAPLPPYILQVLTTDYLIEGTVPGDTRYIFFETDVIIGSPLTLASAQILATSSAGFTPRTMSQFTLLGETVVAYIPRVEANLLPGYDAWKVPELPLSGIFYIGPYVMQGRMMLLRNDLYEEDTPIFDVHIRHRDEGASWTGLYAPFALVNIRWLHGCIPG
jgi:hypothetical protein